MRRLSLTLTILFALVPSVVADQWPRFGGEDGTFKTGSLEGFVSKDLHLAWTTELGTGEAGVLVKDDRILAISLLKQSAEFEDKEELFERVVAIDRASGEVLWSKQYRVEKRKDQESFGASKRSPKATPAVVGDRLVTLGFTGQLKCWAIDDGKLLWERDLVKADEAKPVQFGFSASPVPDSESHVLVSVGGEKGGLSRFEVATGERDWFVSMQSESSYATPVLCELAGVDHILAHSRNCIVGINRATGKQVWTWALPKSGLTNVPTPLPVGNNRIMISGQGLEGTACIQVTNQNAQWEAKQVWLNKRVQFFYCNWMTLNPNTMVACNDKLLFGIDTASGKVLGRWRGYGDANLIADDKRILALHGDGKLSLLTRTDSGLELTKRYRLSKGRYWTPPTIVGDEMFVRVGSKLKCLTTDARGKKLDAVSIKPESYTFTSPQRDYVGEIVAAFEKSGPQAAFKLYSQLHEGEGKKFSKSQRDSLADLAAEQGLSDFEEKIRSDTESVFKNRPQR